MRNVTVILHDEPLEVLLTEEQWTEYSRQEALDNWRLDDWRRKLAETNAAKAPAAAVYSDPPRARLRLVRILADVLFLFVLGSFGYSGIVAIIGAAVERGWLKAVLGR